MKRTTKDMHRPATYFTDFTLAKGLSYLIVVCYVLCVCIICVLEVAIPLPDDCAGMHYQKELPNALYDENICRHKRMARLLYLTPDECSFGRRLVASVVLGGIVGWERRQADRPAGIRTMALVSVGSCLFSITSAMAFLDGPMAWDASRVAAAIPSGVGFLGAGLIFKESQKNEKTGESSHVVHGLTTSASLWISAAVGVACSGGLYFCATFSVGLILTLLRFGPRQHERPDDDDFDEYDDEDDLDDQVEQGYGAPSSSTALASLVSSTRTGGQVRKNDYPSIRSVASSERGRLFGSTKRKNTSRASLGGIM